MLGVHSDADIDRGVTYAQTLVKFERDLHTALALGDMESVWSNDKALTAYVYLLSESRMTDEFAESFLRTYKSVSHHPFPVTANFLTRLAIQTYGVNAL